MAGPIHPVVMASPDYYQICYAINPWMKPEAWSCDPQASLQQAKAQWAGLARRLVEAGLTVEVVPAVSGLPDLVFPANAAIVLDGVALMARFRYPERRGEEPCFLRFFEHLRARGLLRAVRLLPDDVFQEGAGDCIWDDTRGLFWAGYGQRSSAASIGHIQAAFGQKVVGLELITPHYYHLDTCFCPLPGGEIVYYPPAFSAESVSRIDQATAPEQRVVATPDEAAAFSLNAVVVGRDLIMATPPPRLKGLLEARGYRCLDVDLSGFMLSGGAAYCMTLRLDRTSRCEESDHAAV